MERTNTPAKMAYSVVELARALGIGHNKAHDLTHVPGFPVVRIGGRKLIPVKELEAWLSAQAEQQNG